MPKREVCIIEFDISIAKNDISDIIRWQHNISSIEGLIKIEIQGIISVIKIG